MSLNQPFAVRNPRTGKADYFFSLPKAEEIKAKSEILRTNQAKWAAMDIDARINALQQWKAAAQHRQAELVTALSTDTGRKGESLLEVQLLFSSIDRWCGIARDFFSEKITRNTSVPFIEIYQDTVPYPWLGSSVPGIFLCCYLLLMLFPHCSPDVPFLSSLRRSRQGLLVRCRRV